MAQGAPTERDPSQPGYALPDHEPSETAARQLVLRPRLAAFLWIIPISFCGLVLAGCNVIVLFSPDQPSDSRANFVWWALIGAVLLFAPVANFVNSEVRVSNAIVAKRGALRRYKRWPVSELRFIHPYVRYLGGGDFEPMNYVVYRFLKGDRSIAFTLSQAWWKTSDIQALATTLGLGIPPPSTT